jgi:hypothetical protein
MLIRYLTAGLTGAKPDAQYSYEPIPSQTNASPHGSVNYLKI